MYYVYCLGERVRCCKGANAMGEEGRLKDLPWRFGRSRLIGVISPIEVQEVHHTDFLREWK